jgi:hypothetical protein
MQLAGQGLLSADGEAVELTQLGREVYYATRSRFEQPS